VVRLHPDVAGFLAREETVGLEALAARLGRPVTVEGRPDLAAGEIEFED
jgi:hypothetical protein